MGHEPCTMRFGSTAKVLLKCKLKYYRISECLGHGLTTAVACKQRSGAKDLLDEESKIWKCRGRLLQAHPKTCCAKVVPSMRATGVRGLRKEQSPRAHTLGALTLWLMSFTTTSFCSPNSTPACICTDLSTWPRLPCQPQPRFQDWDSTQHLTARPSRNSFTAVCARNGHPSKLKRDFWLQGRVIALRAALEQPLFPIIGHGGAPVHVLMAYASGY